MEIYMEQRCRSELVSRPYLLFFMSDIVPYLIYCYCFMLNYLTKNSRSFRLIDAIKDLMFHTAWTLHVLLFSTQVCAREISRNPKRSPVPNLFRYIYLLSFWLEDGFHFSLHVSLCVTCRYDRWKVWFFNLQALSGRQERLWNVCTDSAGIALINLWG